MANPKLTLLAGTNPSEGGAYGVFNISLDSPAPSGGLTINYNTVGSTATFGVDFTLKVGANISNVTTNTFTIAEGADAATLNIAALADTVIDPNETVSFNLTPSMGYLLDTSATMFSKNTNYNVNDISNFISISVGDFNNDGKEDLALPNSNGISVLLRNADNTGFDTRVNYKANSNSATSINVGDFNHDGKDDVVGISTGNNAAVSVLLRNVDNTGFDVLDYKTSLYVSSSNPSVGVGDFNNDGKDDLAYLVYNTNTSKSFVEVLLRNATNSGFDKVDIQQDGDAISVGDFSGDGKDDLAITNRNNTISVLLRNATNTGFDAKEDYKANYRYNNTNLVFKSGDFNGDGKDDLAVPNGNNVISVLLRNATNTGFDAKEDYHINDFNSFKVGDFNNDGKEDLATSSYYSYEFSVLLRNADNTGFDAGVKYQTGAHPSSFGVGDFNNDGKTNTFANY